MTERMLAVTAKADGRKRRWHQHKVERRNELVDGTI
ncbi:MAG: TetR/AcrR family transcriptional regulator, partial [Mycobacterium sp.]